MLVDESGLWRSLLFAFLLGESAAGYRRPNNAIQDMIPSTGLVNTIVIDSSLAWLDAF